ncbi:MAG: ribosome assembly RNA-binding protein YhbY [Burkholderiales bacterium]
MTLTPARRKELKAQAHGLDPVVLIGGNGLTSAVLKEIDASLTAHELIKVHVAGEDRDSRAAMMTEICGALGAESVQLIGRMLVLFRERPEEPPRAPTRPRGRRGPRSTKRSFQNDE